VLTTTDANLKTTRYGYDGLGRQNKIVSPLGHRTETGYDLAGRASSVKIYGTDGTLLSTTSTQYDAAGNPKQVDLPGGGRVTYGYDNLARLTSVTQLVATTPAPKSITTQYGYDAAGNQTRMIDGRNNSWGATYNPWGLLQDEIEPSTTAHPAITARRFTTVYNAAGLPLTDTLAGGVVVTRTFDVLGRLKTESNPAATGVAAASTSFGYDRLGRMTSASHPSGTIGIAYNERSQITAVTAPGTGSSSFQYDQAGRMTRRSDVAGVATYEWDQADRLSRETDPLTAQRRAYTYTDTNQLQSIVYADSGGSRRDFTYDVYGRLATDTLKGAKAAVMRAVSYGYDAASRVNSETITPAGVAGAGTNTYSYDLAGRLASWTAPNAAVTNYQWDDASNRTAAGNVTFTYDERNRLLNSSDGLINTWSQRGTLASQTINTVTTSYIFDGLGRMNNAGNVTYTYDALDRVATRKNGSAAVAAQEYSGLSMEPSYDGSNDVARSPSGDPSALKVGTGTGRVLTSRSSRRPGRVPPADGEHPHRHHGLHPVR
jgi:YD repeat-containing protein